MTLTIEHVTKRFGGVTAVEDLTLTVEEGRFVCLLGPSGCGKTTTLRMLAGLEFPDAGRIRIADRVLSDGTTGAFVPPERRGVGLVFQSYALWPHMTVAQNIAFGLEMRGWPRPQRESRVRELLELLRITGLDRRYASQLSGGQQQRVALARSLAPGTSVLLLDEPLSNLDAQLRLEMRAELKRLHERLGNTIVFVTHDQLEAMTMASDIAVMRDGRLQQFAPPLEVYRRPANVFVAQFVGSPPMNLFSRGDPATERIAASALTHLRNRQGQNLDGGRTVGVRPEALRLQRARDQEPDVWWQYAAVAEAILPTGADWIVRLRLDGALAYSLAAEEPRFDSGESVVVAVDPAQLHVFGSDGARLKGAERAAPGLARV